MSTKSITRAHEMACDIRNFANDIILLIQAGQPVTAALAAELEEARDQVGSVAAKIDEAE